MSTINSSIVGTTLTITLTGCPTIMIDLTALDEATRQAAALHGLKQKVCDAGALSRDTTTGKSATPMEKYEAMALVAESVLAGVWNRKATGGSGGGEGLLIVALARITGQSLADVRAEVGGWDDKTQAAMRADAAVAPMIAMVKAERARASTPDVDTKALLARFAPKA